MKKKILILGSTGFVGKHFLKHLRSEFSELDIYEFNSNSHIKILCEYEYDIIVNLAGKSQDTRTVKNPDDYYKSNTHLTKIIFDIFLNSKTNLFITLSSVKAVCDSLDREITEEFDEIPSTHYGKSKLLADKYILSKSVPENKRFYILRPSMIHGPGNSGNLRLLYNFISKGIPWPLGAFTSKKSLCSIDNLMFIFSEILQKKSIPSGIYNVADDDSLSLTDIVNIIAESINTKIRIINIPKLLVKIIAKIGNILNLPINDETLKKMTQSLVVSNLKLTTAIGAKMPVTAKDGLIKTIKSFNKYDKAY
jgi:nucleoside-diphosphate-sugar epimerase